MRMAMMAITTNSSISVNATRRRGRNMMTYLREILRTKRETKDDDETAEGFPRRETTNPSAGQGGTSSMPLDHVIQKALSWTEAQEREDRQPTKPQGIREIENPLSANP